MKQPRNEEAYQEFWNFVNLRHTIYLKKEAGEPKPWTDNSIYRDNKLCNVFRILDRQSQFLVKNILEPHWHDNQAIMLFNIFLFRAFNISTTYEQLLDKNTWIDNWSLEKAKDKMYVYVSEGNKFTSGAYMIRGLTGLPKWESILTTLDIIWQEKERLLYDIQKEPTLENAFNQILRSNFWGWGSFTSYQIALDLSYSPILPNPPDINSWCEFGPGSKRGLRLIWPDLPSSNEWLLEACKYLLADQVKYREPHVPELDLQSVEFVACELQKVMRIKRGEGHAKERYPGAI